MTVNDTLEAVNESQAAAIFREVLHKAAAAVEDSYFRHPYATETRQPSSRHYERAYCAELYHHVRHLLETSQDPEVAATVAAGYRVSLELPKQLTYIGVERAPDLLWHVPGERTNSVIVEVKPSPATLQRMEEDVDKLVRFKGEPALYAHGVLLIFGDPMSAAKKRKLRILRDQAEVVVLLHEAPGARPTEL